MLWLLLLFAPSSWRETFLQTVMGMVMNYWKNVNGLENFTSPAGQHEVFPDLDEPSVSDYLLGNVPYPENSKRLFLFENRVEIDAGANLIGGCAPPIREESDISCFSNNSRRRLIKLLSRVNFSSYSSIFFLTTTFHNEFPEDNKSLKYFLSLFLKKFQYHYPSADYLWRLEFQERGAPHFHFFLLFPKKYTGSSEEFLRRRLNLFWNSLLVDCSELTLKHSTCLDSIGAKRSVMGYVCKYTCKTETPPSAVYNGRHYGYSKTICLKPLVCCDCPASYLRLVKEAFYQYLRQNNCVTEEMAKNFFSCGHISFCLEVKTALEICLKVARENHFNFVTAELLGYYLQKDEASAPVKLFIA